MRKRRKKSSEKTEFVFQLSRTTLIYGQIIYQNMSPSEVNYKMAWLQKFLDAGVDETDARVFIRHNIALSEALTWIDAGFTAEEAVFLKGAGIKPKTAKGLRKLGLSVEEMVCSRGPHGGE